MPLFRGPWDPLVSSKGSPMLPEQYTGISRKSDHETGRQNTSLGPHSGHRTPEAIRKFPVAGVEDKGSGDGLSYIPGLY